MKIPPGTQVLDARKIGAIEVKPPCPITTPLTRVDRPTADMTLLYFDSAVLLIEADWTNGQTARLIVRWGAVNAEMPPRDPADEQGRKMESVLKGRIFSRACLYADHFSAEFADGFEVTFTARTIKILGPEESTDVQ